MPKKKTETREGARYPFPVYNRGNVVIDSYNYSNALNKVLSKYPNRFVKTKFAKHVEQYLQRLNAKECVKVSKHNGFTSGSLIDDAERFEDMTPNIKTKLKHKLFMDLITARDKAQKDSRNGKTIFVNVDTEGECFLCPYADSTTYAAFKGGGEIAVPIAPPLKRISSPISKHKQNKKMKLPDELDLPQGVELPEEEPTPKKTPKAKKKLPKEAPVIALQPDMEEETIEDTPEEAAPRRKPVKKGKAKPLKISKLAKKGKVATLPPKTEAPTKGSKKATKGSNLPAVKRKGKTATKTRAKKEFNRTPKNKPSALQVEEARKQLAMWAKERGTPAKKSKRK